jgi:hypothetical protein
VSEESEKQEAVCMTIVIVGALRKAKLGESGDQIAAFLKEVDAALWRHFPDFLPAHPAITINTADVRDDWIKRP